MSALGKLLSQLTRFWEDSGKCFAVENCKSLWPIYMSSTGLTCSNCCLYLCKVRTLFFPAHFCKSQWFFGLCYIYFFKKWNFGGRIKAIRQLRRLCVEGLFLPLREKCNTYVPIDLNILMPMDCNYWVTLVTHLFTSTLIYNSGQHRTWVPWAVLEFLMYSQNTINLNCYISQAHAM